MRASAGNTRSPTSFASARVAGILSRPVTATVYVNGVPGIASAENLLGYNEVSLDIDRNGGGHRQRQHRRAAGAALSAGPDRQRLTSGAIGATPARGDAVAIKDTSMAWSPTPPLDIDGNGWLARRPTACWCFATVWLPRCGAGRQRRRRVACANARDGGH